MGAGGRARGRSRPGRRGDQVAAAVHGHDGGAAGAGRVRSAAISTLLKEVLSETGYLETLENERTIEAQGRIENLEELVNVAVEYDAGAADEEPRWPTSCSRWPWSPTPTRARTTRAW